LTPRGLARAAHPNKALRREDRLPALGRLGRTLESWSKEIQAWLKHPRQQGSTEGQRIQAT